MIRQKAKGKRQKNMHVNRALPTFFLFPFSFCLLLLASCQPYGGAEMYPEKRLRNVESLDLRPMEVAPTTTKPTTQATTQAAVEYTITLEEVRQLALQNNLELKISRIAPTIARQGISEEEARFEAVFTTDVNYSLSDSPTASTLNGSSVRSLNITPGLQIPLRTGGTINLDVPMNRFETDNQFSTLNPSYSSDVAASISQPLLRGGGVDVTLQRLKIAAWNWQSSQAQTKLEVIRVLAAADRIYWRLYAARRDLEVRRKEFDLAMAQLERARRQVLAGAVAEVEIIRAESGVSDRVEGIINAENALRDRQRELKRIINQPGLEIDTPTIVIPGTPPRPVPYKLDPHRVMNVAMDQRMELIQLELQILQENANVFTARNDMLPLLSLDYTYNVNGLGASFDDTFDMVADKNFEDHRIGVRMQVPIGNEAARSRLRRALSSRMQTLLSKDQRKLAIEQEVFNAMDQLEANWQRILATRQRTILNARLLDAEIRQFDLGLRTSTDVLNAQTTLANAQSAEIAAVTEYQISQVDVAFATGMVLGASGVSWDPTPAPKP